MSSLTSDDDIRSLIGGTHHDPFSVLGLHPCASGVVVRALVPAAESVAIVLPAGVSTNPSRSGSATTLAPDAIPDIVPMTRCHSDGFFEVALDDLTFPYRMEVAYPKDHTLRILDPYSFPPFLSDFDLHLFGEGQDLHLYDKLGAHPRFHCHTPGVAFSVWAPNAVRVSVVGNFNGWNGLAHPMRARGASGVWELFIPELVEGEYYKYEIATASGNLLLKSDPYSIRMEHRPRTASVVYQLPEPEWTDQEWMESRATSDPFQSPMSIYEVHLSSWMRVPEEGNRSLSYEEHADRLVDYVVDMGFTHVELMPILEHPLDESWGYQVTGYFAPTSRYGSPANFQALVNRFHQRGIGVILDWVPAHFPTDAHALARFDGTALYEHEDPRLGSHPDWGTLIFNYSRNEVRNFLVSNALYWLERFHIDGLRVDAVASMLYLDYSREPGEWIPNRYGGRENLEAIEFMKQLNTVVHQQAPGVLMIAEESTAWPGVSRPVHLGGLGFGYKWNMGWMNDILTYFSGDPIYRKYHQDSLTFGLVYAFTENFILPLSHDEVVHGKRSLLDKMPGDIWQKFANLRLLYGFMFAHPGRKLLFMGGEFGQWSEWNSGRSLDWHLLENTSHKALQDFVKALNVCYRNEPALYRSDTRAESFEWIDFQDTANSVVSFLRHSDDTSLVCVCNFTPEPRFDYQIGVPDPGHYDEILNSDSNLFGGGNIGNLGGASATETPAHGRAWSIQITVPPLAVVYFKRR